MIDKMGLLLSCLSVTPVARASGRPPRMQRQPVEATLFDAASVGDRRRIQKLLRAGLDPNCADEDGTTALMAAVFAGQVEAVRVLLEAGADPDLQDVSGMTALMNVVIANGELEPGETHEVFREILELLLDHGADLDLEDEDGSTAMDLARSFDLGDFVDLLSGIGA